eukprot:763413-Rhodomonas_salina.1
MASALSRSTCSITHALNSQPTAWRNTAFHMDPHLLDVTLRARAAPLQPPGRLRVQLLRLRVE